MNKFLVFLIGLVFTLASCEKEKAGTNDDFSSGIFVVNQGVFQGGTGTITYRKESTNILINDLFATQNGGKPLGNVAQSIIKFDNKYFIAVNNAAKIQVVNAADFKFIGEIPIDLPRYFATDGTKLYVTSYNNDFASGKINEIDTKNLFISSSLNVPNLPENMLFSNSNLYVTLTSPYGQSSQDVIVLDTRTNKITNTIAIGDSPSAIVTDKNGDIWVLCTGNLAFDPEDNTSGSLHRLRDDQKVDSFVFGKDSDGKPLSPNGLVIDGAGDKLYFLMDGKVMAHDITDNTFENESIYDGFFYGISYERSSGRIFLANARDFASQGEVLFINPKTNATGRFATGIIPGFIYFSE